MPVLAKVVVPMAVGSCLLAGHLSVAAAPSSGLVAFTRNHNVFLTTLTGKSITQITTRGTGSSANPVISYPQYSWSPDGRYLLLTKSVGPAAGNPSLSLLLVNRAGQVVRTLAAKLPGSPDFYPAWAMDTDQIAYIARVSSGRAIVNRVDTGGHAGIAWSYAARPEGCGGGTGIPAEATLWRETGFGESIPSLQWSTGGHIAVYTSSCAGGVNVTDLHSGRTRSLGLAREVSWANPSLSPTGRLAVTVESFVGPSRQERVAIVNPYSGAVTRTVGPGNLASWTAGGRSLLFVQRVQQGVWHMRDRIGNRLDDPYYSTSIVQVDPDGQHPVTVARMNVYGAGPLRPASGSRVVFSTIDNDWKLWQRRDSHNVVDVRGYAGPSVSVRSLDLSSRRLTTLVAPGGLPAVQP